jgi:hypothetical protein
VIVKVAVVAPAATVTEVGTVAAVVEELFRVTTLPPEPAAPFSVTVPVTVTLLPPTTVVDESVTLERLAGCIVREAVVDAVPRVAVIVALELEDTATVVIVKVAVLEPEATVTVDGIVALVLLELKLTAVPPVGAAVLRVTVPVKDVPPTTDAELRVTELTVIGFTVRTAEPDMLL